MRKLVLGASSCILLALAALYPISDLYASGPESLIPEKSYVLIITGEKRDGNLVKKRFANGILLDTKLGLIATNAHVVASGYKYRARIGSIWYDLKTSEAWIAPDNKDLAILQIHKPAGPDLSTTENAPLAENLPEIGQTTEIHGFDPKDYSPYQYDAVVLKTGADWSCAGGVWELFVLKEKLAENQILTKLERIRLFEDFVCLLVWNSKKIRDGMSGSAILHDNKVIGMVAASSTDGKIGLGIPAYEIRAFHEKIKSLLDR